MVETLAQARLILNHYSFPIIKGFYINVRLNDRALLIRNFRYFGKNNSKNGRLFGRFLTKKESISALMAKVTTL